MSNELVPIEDQERTLQIFDMKPQAMVASATEIANVLSDVINRQGLFANIQGNKYVKLEGWNLLGSLLGVLPRERNVKELEDGSYEATVELISTKNGAIVGCGSAICSVTEKRWGNAEKFARRSMCITRATAKAYRLGMSWIINLAGYEATPYEEIVDVGQSIYREPPKQTAPKPGPQVKLFEASTENNKLIKEHFEREGVSFGDDNKNLYEVRDMMLGKPVDEAEAMLVEFVKGLKNV